MCTHDNQFVCIWTRKYNCHYLSKAHINIVLPGHVLIRKLRWLESETQEKKRVLDLCTASLYHYLLGGMDPWEKQRPTHLHHIPPLPTQPLLINSFLVHLFIQWSKILSACTPWSWCLSVCKQRWERQRGALAGRLCKLHREGNYKWTGHCDFTFSVASLRNALPKSIRTVKTFFTFLGEKKHNPSKLWLCLFLVWLSSNQLISCMYIL